MYTYRNIEYKQMSKTKTYRRRLHLSHKRKYRKHNSRNGRTKTKRGGEGYWERRATERRARKAKPATLWSPWRYAKESGRLGEGVKKTALEKLSRRQDALKIDNSNSEILSAAQNANAAFKRGLDDIHNRKYAKGVNTLTSATDQLEKDTNAKAGAATAEFESRKSALDSKLGEVDDMFGNMKLGHSNVNPDEVDRVIKETADALAKENARRLPSPGKKRVSKN
jgi:hypothetical protein